LLLLVVAVEALTVVGVQGLGVIVAVLLVSPLVVGRARKLRLLWVLELIRSRLGLVVLGVQVVQRSLVMVATRFSFC
jgi:hypothetical protein